MKPVAWIKIRELTYMQAVQEYGKNDWQTNLGLKPEPDDEGLYTETQVQKMRESFEQSVTDPENQPSQYGTVPMKEWVGQPDLARVGEVGVWGDKREWVGFTHEELAWLNEALNLGGRFAVIEAIEAKLKEKNA